MQCGVDVGGKVGPSGISDWDARRSGTEKGSIQCFPSIRMIPRDPCRRG